MAEPRYDYLRDPAAIYRRSFALIGGGRLSRASARRCVPLALRLAHAAGDVAILDDLRVARRGGAAARKALAAGAPSCWSSEMVAAGITARRSAQPRHLRRSAMPALAERAAPRTTRSAAAVELWRPHLARRGGGDRQCADGAVSSARNDRRRARRAPALILGFPVGFVGAAEAKEALIGFGRGASPIVALKGRRGGSALAAAAVNALCAEGRA